MNKSAQVLVLIICLVSSLTPLNAETLYVSAHGSASGKGTIQDPLTFPAAIELASSILKENGLPQDGLTIEIEEGRYRFEELITLGSEFQGTKLQPIRIQAAQGARVVFDGSKQIAAKQFRPVYDLDEKGRLAKTAADKIVVATISDPAMIRRFNEKLMLNLIIDSTSYTPSVFPNQGYARLKVKTVTPEVCPPGIPVGQEAYSVRAGVEEFQAEGKAKGWKGSLAEPCGARVGFADGSNDMAGSWIQWEKEIKRNNRRNQITGFLEANWLLSSQSIVAASDADQCIHLSRALGYGWGWRKDKPFRVFGLLCELDQPGEWHFDPQTNRLYVYPPQPIQKSQLSVSVAPGFLRLNNNNHVQIIGLNVENVATGRVYQIASGEHNLIAGCTIRDCTATGLDINGTNNSAKGCDLIDLHQHVRLSGGSRSPEKIVAGGNLVENCHIYQRSYRHTKVNIGMGGVGNAFRNNLVHNSLGQAMTVNGNDHLVELNEFFNIGFDEGDGGAVYSGADLTGYGNTYRHNFFHHLMHVAGKVPRAGIHFDDHQAGSICIGNIFFKSAEKGIFYNGGAGHVAKDNVFLEGDFGIYNVANVKSYERQHRISNDPDRANDNSKENYVGRAERIVGEAGWLGPVWGDRYPVFRQVMSDNSKSGRMLPIRCEIDNNFFHGNRKANRTYFARSTKEILEKNLIQNDRSVTPDDFVDYRKLDLRFKDPGGSMPEIPFQQIGLYFDSYRSRMPDKTHYRSQINQFFDGIISMAGTAKRTDTARIVEDKTIERPSTGERN